MSTILITGANRGIGLEATRQFAAAGHRVLACCRRPHDAKALRALDPSPTSVHALDVTDVAAIRRLADELGGEALDVLLLNAGIYPEKARAFGDLDEATWLDAFRVNTIAPGKMAEAFVEHVARSERKIIAVISSQMGSIAENSGGSYAYRTSKAAVNMVVSNLALDLGPRGLTCVVLHPGWVQTDMGGGEAPVTPEESVRGLEGVIDGLTRADNGKFFGYDGRSIPW